MAYDEGLSYSQCAAHFASTARPGTKLSLQAMCEPRPRAMPLEQLLVEDRPRAIAHASGYD